MSDPRAAAFLREMGIETLWLLRSPAAAPALPPELVPVAETPAPAAPDPVDDMDWPALRAAIAGCQRCGLCKSGRPLAGEGAERARWLVVAGPVNSEMESAASVLAGDAGQLLVNMLHAAGHGLERDTYVTPLVKCRPSSGKGADRAPTPEEIAACRPYLLRELALSGADTVLTLGQAAANGVLERPLDTPLASARGQTHRVGAAQLVATLRPQDLLRQPADKAEAWADLCRARGRDGSA
ncbi:uracil-DNA glycosylase [Massilia sp. TS11]|uniref:uracil-DNA glycosylase n=1 Tax=Massilia sp. TS11 TaxID=2908003 RepID=UPI001EDAA16C|nr:uracil-DNA glycosylase [Massilia sp. TS11]MCG2584253.1 uracil-DNA glycosylase [Massilia sp. TS11]